MQPIHAVTLAALVLFGAGCATGAKTDLDTPGVYTLFGGEDLKGWRVCKETVFEDHGKVWVENGAVHMESGKPMTGIAWKGDFPRENYEVSLDGMRVAGNDFFCGMTFPVGEEYCTLILGGWGGMVVGLSNVDGMAAADNQTTTGKTFEEGRWYRIRLRVTPEAVGVWVDDAQIIDLDRKGHRFDIWWEQEPARPFGINTWYTHGALRSIVVQRFVDIGNS